MSLQFTKGKQNISNDKKKLFRISYKLRQQCDFSFAYLKFHSAIMTGLHWKYVPPHIVNGGLNYFRLSRR